MNTAELKSDLHRLVVETNDIDILAHIRQYFLQLQTKDVDWWDTITAEQKSSIQTGIEQLNQGKGIAHQQVRQKVTRLFSENGQ
jgi:hypothetical protein